jgi:Asparagine synthase
VVVCKQVNGSQPNHHGLDPEPLTWIRPTAFEIASGAVWGSGSELRPQDFAPVSPRLALEAAIQPALERPPCLVAFSGGRDSSAVLAVSVHLARRLGFPLPIPVSRRWPSYPATDEAYWQELVIAHLGVDDWERVELEEMDLVGPTCVESLARHGPLWPPLIHTWPPLFGLAGGGSILTGEGGDELFEVRRATPVRRIAAYPRSVRWPLVREGIARAAPAWRRRLHLRSELATSSPAWLLPEAKQRWLDELEEWAAGEPYRWRPAVRRAITDRGHEIGACNLQSMAALVDVRLFQPLLDPRFVAALLAAGGPLGFPGRTSAMRQLFGDLLPDELLTRADKKYTTTVVLGDATRAFAQAWDGTGLDVALVDGERLRSALLAADIHPAVALALQAAWCFTRTSGA